MKRANGSLWLHATNLFCVNVTLGVYGPKTLLIWRVCLQILAQGLILFGTMRLIALLNARMQQPPKAIALQKVGFFSLVRKFPRMCKPDLEHVFTGLFGACRFCGLYVEQCLAYRYCPAETTPEITYPVLTLEELEAHYWPPIELYL